MNKISLKKFVSLHQALLAEKSKLESRLAAIDKALGASGVGARAAATKTAKKKSKFSAAARAAIAAAQHKRWAKVRAAKKAAAK